jgi:hypothetical protein
MRTKRMATTAIMAAVLAIAALFGTASGAAATTNGSAGYATGSSWVQCGDWWVLTHIEGAVHWQRTYTYYPYYGSYWLITPVSDMVEINDPSPIRDECGGFTAWRTFDLMDYWGNVVASGQSANSSLSHSGCVGYWYDPNYWSLWAGCNYGYYYFYYTHPAGYIRVNGSVFPNNYGGGWSGSSGWRSLGG